jgi:hypothetical protein
MTDAPFTIQPWVRTPSFHDAPFHTNPPQNHTDLILNDFSTEYFNASLQAQQYASGGIESAPARAWVTVLFLVFIMNLFVLIYFILHRGLVTDFSEPPNLFALAVNSPPSHVLAGSCGGGPEGKQYMVNWFVNHEGNHLFMEPGEKTALLDSVHAHGHGELGMSEKFNKGGVFATVAHSIRQLFGKTPVKYSKDTATERLRPVPASRPPSMVRPSMQDQERPGSMVSEYEMMEGYERTRKHYNKLANRRSVFDHI